MSAGPVGALFQITDRYTFCWGHEVAQLVEALRYMPVGRGFDS